MAEKSEFQIFVRVFPWLSGVTQFRQVLGRSFARCPGNLFFRPRMVRASLVGPDPASVWPDLAVEKLVTDCCGRLGVAQPGQVLERFPARFSRNLRFRPRAVGASLAGLAGPDPVSVWPGLAVGKLVTDCVRCRGVAQARHVFWRSRARFPRNFFFTRATFVFTRPHGRRKIGRARAGPGPVPVRSALPLENLSPIALCA